MHLLGLKLVLGYNYDFFLLWYYNEIEDYILLGLYERSYYIRFCDYIENIEGVWAYYKIVKSDVRKVIKMFHLSRICVFIISSYFTTFLPTFITKFCCFFLRLFFLFLFVLFVFDLYLCCRLTLSINLT